MITPIPYEITSVSQYPSTSPSKDPSDKNVPTPSSPPSFFLSTAPSAVTKTSPPGPFPVTSSVPPYTPSISPSSMLSTMSTDAHYISPRYYPSMVPSFTTSTRMFLQTIFQARTQQRLPVFHQELHHLLISDMCSIQLPSS